MHRRSSILILALFLALLACLCSAAAGDNGTLKNTAALKGQAKDPRQTAQKGNTASSVTQSEQQSREDTATPHAKESETVAPPQSGKLSARLGSAPNRIDERTKEILLKKYPELIDWADYSHLGLFEKDLIEISQTIALDDYGANLDALEKVTAELKDTLKEAREADTNKRKKQLDKEAESLMLQVNQVMTQALKRAERQIKFMEFERNAQTEAMDQLLTEYALKLATLSAALAILLTAIGYRYTRQARAQRKALTKENEKAAKKLKAATRGMGRLAGKSEQRDKELNAKMDNISGEMSDIHKNMLELQEEETQAAVELFRGEIYSIRKELDGVRKTIDEKTAAYIREAREVLSEETEKVIEAHAGNAYDLYNDLRGMKEKANKMMVALEKASQKYNTMTARLELIRDEATRELDGIRETTREREEEHREAREKIEHSVKQCLNGKDAAQKTKKEMEKRLRKINQDMGELSMKWQDIEAILIDMRNIKDRAEHAWEQIQKHEQGAAAQVDRLRTNVRRIRANSTEKRQREARSGNRNSLEKVILDKKTSLFDKIKAKAQLNQKDEQWMYAISMWELVLEDEEGAKDINNHLDMAYCAIIQESLGTGNSEELFELAVKHYELASRIKDSAEIQVNGASALVGWASIQENADEKAGMLAQSISRCKEAVDLDDEYAPAYFVWGDALDEEARMENHPTIREAKFERACHKLKIAIEIDPAYVDAHFNLACARILMGKSNYLDALESALRLDADGVCPELRTDKDFDSVRDTTEFQALLSRYCPDNQPESGTESAPA